MKFVRGAVMLAALVGGGCAGDDEGPAPYVPPVPCNGQCPFLTKCSMRLCVADFQPGTYAFLLGAGDIPLRVGSDWDTDGPPDAYVTVSDGTRPIGTGRVIEDSYAPKWDEMLPTVALETNANLRFDVYDDDGVTDELMFSCTGSLLTYIKEKTFFGNCAVDPSMTVSRVSFTLTFQ